MRVRIIQTEDGSHSLINESLNETYHSIHGAIQESTHVFIKNGLHHVVATNKLSSISILEVGFGTGLNAFLTLKESLALNVHVHFTAIEAFPVSADIIAHLNYPQQLDFAGAAGFFHQLHATPWDAPVIISPTFTLEKKLATIDVADFTGRYHDLIFFDAFAPVKQPEMWELPVIEKTVNALSLNGIFVTYCAQGQLKRNLKQLGLTVETLAGPPGKREMVRAQRLN